MDKNFIFQHIERKVGQTSADEDFYLNRADGTAVGGLLQMRMFIDSRWRGYRTVREISDDTAFIGLILSGRTLRGEEMLCPGDVIVEKCRSMPLVSRAVGDEELHRLVIILSRTPVFLSLAPVLFPENITIIRKSAAAGAGRIFASIREAVAADRSEAEVSVMLFRLFQELNSARNVTRRHPALDKALEFIRRHGFTALSRESIARAAGVSDRQLGVLFRQYMHTTPSAYLTSRRIAFAKELLASRRMSISETAAASGFASPEFFIRTFRRHTGTTPGKWSR